MAIEIYNVSKSSLLVFGCSTKVVQPELLQIGKITLPIKHSVVYAGVYVSNSKSSVERTQLACEKLRKLINVNHDCGLYFGGFNPISAVYIWRRVLLPCAIYGCNVWGKLSQREYDMLEATQRFFMKKVQGLSKRTPNVIVQDTLKVTSLQGYIDQQSLLLLGKLCNARSMFVFKQMFLFRFGQFKCKMATVHKKKFDTKSPVYNMLRLVFKYDLCDEINNYINTSQFQKKHIWSQIVKDKINAYETV